MRFRSIFCLLAIVIAGCGGTEEDEAAGPSGAGQDPTTFGAETGNGSNPSNPNAPSADGGPGSGDGGGGGGQDAGPGPACVGSAADPAAAATVSGFMDKLTGTKPTGVLRTEIIDAIIKSCHVFAPKVPGFEREHCWAHLASAIQKESSYNPTAHVLDGYAKRMIGTQQANDPIVGLLQIRFSSTVASYASNGNLEALSCVGCNFPATFDAHKNESGSSTFWAVTGPTQNLALMRSASCNVGLGAWYYYVHATGNGSPTKPIYVTPYCGGQGVAANLVTGLRSHLQGSEKARGVIQDLAGLNMLQSADPNAHSYITAIKTQFDKMIPAGGGTHPFFVTLPPNPPQYCR